VRVLVACEFSGVVRDAFTRAGHDATSCDFLETEISGKHVVGDVKHLLKKKWDLIIAHPPCTYLSNSGVMWLHRDKARWKKMIEGAYFFKMFLESNCKKICVENPIMHGYAKEIIGVNQTQVIQPWMFGHMEQKATCLWLKGLPQLVPTKDVKKKMMKLPDSQRQRLHYLPPGKDRQKERSRTFQGIANAMAEQWGINFPNSLQGY